MTAWASTGLDGLDKILCDLKKGDNVVWQVDSIEEYSHFVAPYVKRALQQKRDIVYIRFAEHQPIVENCPDVKVYQLDPGIGFETFSKHVHAIISDHGKEAYYVFDCLSELLSAWATDLMIGNFFMMTCPYLFELDTVTYFAIMRNHHSFQTVARIRETTQLLLDLYNFDGKYYVHPLKVWNRYSPTMFLPHCQQGEEFLPVTTSVDATRLLSHISERGLDGLARSLDYWDRLFMEAEDLKNAPCDSNEVKELVSELCRIMVGRERRFTELAESIFTIEDLMSIKSRLIGSGRIGGKAAGMLLAQKILCQDDSFDWAGHMEPHDSFFIGSDVFYTYIVENGWWKLLMEQKTKEGYFKAAPELKANLLEGKFPTQVCERFQELVEYFGQSPIIIRSSSLLEDSFGNAFAGKYESIFRANQADPEQRYLDFVDAVRQVYASTMDESALVYRLERGLAEQDEQMALLVQRVSGSYKSHYFFPDLAGVGVSYNTFVWNSELDPQAGMLRLVYGLGTRAVDRVEDDYPQTIALDDPLLRPYAERGDVGKFAQRKVDLLDTAENRLTTVDAIDVLNDDPGLSLDLVANVDRHTQQLMKEHGIKDKRAWVLTFKKLLAETDFTQTMQRMMKSLEKRYHYPVDIEFTVNFAADESYRINLVQCRPLQTKGIEARVQIPPDIDNDKILFSSHGYTMGGSISQFIKRIIYVDPAGYVDLPIKQKYSIARIVGDINKQAGSRDMTPTILFGPGRWGTTTPSLGVPVKFAEISKVSVLVEIAYEGGNLMPDLSFGTHFFQDLVESDIFYVALFPRKTDVVFNTQKLEQMPNMLCDLSTEGDRFKDVVKVIDLESKSLRMMSDIVTQEVVCFFA
jgi:hypothetical protein